MDTFSGASIGRAPLMPMLPTVPNLKSWRPSSPRATPRDRMTTGFRPSAAVDTRARPYPRPFSSQHFGVVFKMLSEMMDNLNPWTQTGNENAYDVVRAEGVAQLPPFPAPLCCVR